MYQILPYIEQTGVYNNNNDTQVYQTPIGLYYCPSRRPPALYGSSAKTDYAGNAGDGQTAYNGAIIRRGCVAAVNFTLIVDGTSNTLLIGEKQTNPSNFGGSGGDNESWPNSGWDQDEIRWGGSASTPQSDLQHPTEPPTFWSSRFGSAHASTFNGLMADGSVRSFSYSIDAENFRRICVRNDRQTVELP